MMGASRQGVSRARLTLTGTLTSSDQWSVIEIIRKTLNKILKTWF